MRYILSMRGSDERLTEIFSYVRLKERIAADHPLRPIRAMVDAALRELDLHFAALYARRGRPSIPPEQLVRALLLMILHSIRGERLIQGAVTKRLFAAVLEQALERDLLSEEHFTVDGTLIRAGAHRDSLHATDEPQRRAVPKRGRLCQELELTAPSHFCLSYRRLC